ncbi:MAG: hydantoinase/oxoprolinase family protein [Betaproteobacteria bacterium]|nr:hydantoinase/oxoprolinase family protein [Betaproteobacteria bacterium]MDH4322928.1 hydantoinase/oxoprolinase family protein [Betaproteobacteria bacterium]MDH5210087.1 hydantoinase/oxoprolinase family protein [Betaproteobacteria bacterium]
MSYLVGIDIGGTFTDCAIVDRAGKLLTTKVPSTPQDFSQGMMDALKTGAQALDLTLDDFCRDIAFLSHGTTVGTNTIIQKKGAKVGLLTTKGHEDAIHIMRGSRGYGGRDIRKVVHFPETAKPAPIVPKRLIRGVSERVDCFGEVVAALNEAQAESAIRELVAEGVQAIAICLLWSFRNSKHELRLRDLVRKLAPDLFVTCSVDIAPKWGEYERVTATALNAYLGPVMSGYLAKLDRTLTGLGYAHGLQIAQCGGGTVPVARAGEAPLLTLDSGPVAGVTASSFLGAAMGEKNIITTDMGGTSFDVSIIHDGKPAYAFISNTDQYEYFLPKVDLQAIGAGGGSLAQAHPETRTLTVGPESAGAFPGPVCYGRGGTVATVTDAQLVLGYLDPDNFAGGRMRLDRKAAHAAIEALGAKIGMGAVECAAGICRIVELNMADVIRKVTVEKGYDPRDFVLFAFGGAGPAHAGVFAAELGVKKVIVPQRKAASTWCAFGAAAADVLHIFEHSEILVTPVRAAQLNASLEAIEKRARAMMAGEGIAPARQRFEFSLDVRHRGQINEVEVLMPWKRLPVGYEPRLRKLFVARYEKLYGRGSALAGAQLEIVVCRLRARALTPRPRLTRAKKVSRAAPKAARLKPRMIWWKGLKKTPVYDGEKLAAGNVIRGPAIVETADTTVVVHPGTTLRVDALDNFEITFK